MAVLPNFNEFSGIHYETGVVRNVLAYQKTTAPHTGKALSEALMLGISGGITVGYFTFEYTGYLPHVALLTRNTFDPMQTLLERLAVPVDVLHTSNPAKGEENLIAALESGSPAIVWADRFMLPYNLLNEHQKDWMMAPLIVYGMEGDTVSIGDRSHRPFQVTREELMRARARVKEDKFRVMTLGAPDFDKLPAAVQKGIWQCISLYTEAPPKGKKDNFGFAALQYWAKMLTNNRNKQSWERFFAPGSRMYAALAGDLYQPGVWGWIMEFGTADGADRGTYADFLDEAAVILNKPGLKEAASQFRAAHKAWNLLADAVLPDKVPLFKEARELRLRKRQLFLDKGQEGTAERHQINTRLMEIKALMQENFPLNADEAAAMRENLAEHVLKIHDIEFQAVAAMQSAIS